MSFPAASAVDRAAALIPAASDRERLGLLPTESGPKLTSKRIAVLSATAKASLSSFVPAAGLGGAGGAVCEKPELGLFATGMISFSIMASITEKRDRLRAATDLLTSDTLGSSRAVLTAFTLLLASTIRARTPATSRVRGGGAVSGGKSRVMSYGECSPSLVRMRLAEEVERGRVEKFPDVSYILACTAEAIPFAPVTGGIKGRIVGGFIFFFRGEIKNIW